MGEKRHRAAGGISATGPVCYFRTMATIQEAVQNAATFARETLGPQRTAGLRLEEVESGQINGEEAWLLTLSMISDPQSAIGVLSDAGNLFSQRREYKIFAVLKKTGEIASMKIRELAVT